MLLGIVSCKNPPSLKAPVKIYEVSLEFREAGVGFKSFNYKAKRKYVGEWVNLEDVQFIPLEDIPTNLHCFSSKDWQENLKPFLKKGSQYYHDYKKKKRKK